MNPIKSMAAGRPAICHSLLCHARAAFALQTAPILAPRGRTVELGAFSLRHPSPRATSVRFFLHRAHARIWQALRVSHASAMAARVVALLALALLAVTDAVPRRVKQVKHGKLQPSRHRADPTATPPELVHSTWQRQPPRFRPFV